jgi:hypothetical protein
VFADNPLAGEGTIPLLVFMVQLLSSGFLLGRIALDMKFLRALIAPIPEA